MSTSDSEHIDPATESRSIVWKRRFFFWLRLTISLGLMAVIILYFVPEEDRPRIITAYSHLHPGWFLLAVLATFTDRFVSGWKWLMLLRAREPEVPAWPVLQVFFVSTFFGYFLPSSIGGDALRIFALNRVRKDLAGSASSVVIDRAYGTLGLLLLSALAIIPVAGQVISIQEAWLFWGITFVALVGVIVLSSRRVNSWLVSSFQLDAGGRIRGKIFALAEAFATFLHAKSKLFAVFFFSMSVQVLRVLIVVFFSYSLGFDLHPVVYFIYVPLITVVTFLPFSIAGIGVREALFIFFFTRPEVGLSEQQAVSLSLLFFTSGIIATIPGLVIFLFTGIGKQGSHQKTTD